MIQRGLHEDDIAAAQAMDRSSRTYFYIKASPEWLALRNRLESRVRDYAWLEWLNAFTNGKYGKAGDICYAFDLIGLRALRKDQLEKGISEDWW